MAHIEHLSINKILETPIRRNDGFTFENGLDYSVSYNFLSCTGKSNSQILTDLKVKNKYLLAYYTYGYLPRPGNWPPSKDEDYQALSRMLAAVLAIESKVNIKIRMPDRTVRDFFWKDWVHPAPLTMEIGGIVLDFSRPIHEQAGSLRLTPELYSEADGLYSLVAAYLR